MLCAEWEGHKEVLGVWQLPGGEEDDTCGPGVDGQETV